MQFGLKPSALRDTLIPRHITAKRDSVYTENVGASEKQTLFKFSYFSKVVNGWTVILILLIMSENLCAQKKMTTYVNPLVGTDGHGHTYPGASLPFGMVQLSPDTDTEGWDWCSGYHYSDNSIMGFSHTHLSGTGCADYGDILFMPTTGELKTEPGKKDIPGSGYRSRFNHKNEIATPGYYSVLLDDYNIKAELTVTKRTGFHKYIFPKTESANIIIDLVHGIQDKAKDAQIKIIDNRIIEGYRNSSGWGRNHTVYFYAEFSKPFKSFGIVEDGKISEGKTSAQSRELKAFVGYSTSSNETIFVKVGISHSSLEGARKNLKEEIAGWNFDKIKKQAETEWEKSLSTISIKDKNEKNKTIFYTALYHSLLTPNILSDVDGSYIGMDKKIHAAKNHEMLTVFSLWDTFRAEHPLFTLIDSKKANDMAASLVSKYEENGMLPVWEMASNDTWQMIGNHSIPVIVDAYFKGIRNYDVEKAFEAMKKTAMMNHNGLDLYNEMGFINADLEHESVSKTLEYAYDDWCIARMAKDLGKVDDYNFFIERAKFYVNVFDPSTLLMRPKKNGKWLEPFDPYSVSGNYTEANAWQYSFFVPQDVNGFKKLMGGDEKFISRLDDLFTVDPQLTGKFQPDITGLIGQYAHGNEPSHHMAYLYNYAGVPQKTQKIVREILSTLYTEKPDGLSGNDDCGQMSAWYIFSSLGFYPVCPGDNNYIIGTPLFEKAVINAGGGKNFTIVAKNLSDKNFYVQSVKLNGKDYPYSYIKHSDIINGCELIFEMGPLPSNWGKEISSRPVSEIDIPFTAVPVLASGERNFKDSTVAAISSIDGSSKIYFTIDGSDPTTSGKIYSSPIVLRNTTSLKMVSLKDGTYSKVVTANFNKITEGKSIKLNTQYHQAYKGGGDNGLIDEIKGKANFRSDAWQGYEGVDLDAVADLGSVQKISAIKTSFLQDVGSWIFFPTFVEYYVSADGKNFTKVFDAENAVDEKKNDSGIKDFEKTLNGIEVRYVKVIAKNVGVCPQWHVGAGGNAWLFVDEIEIK
ncbi:MAG: glycoside hydrolase family 92 protein [Ignavibacteriales bacterium]|nr:glycoside hydrolase family 92 protein [Ignavibacteriales bacterium]